MSQSRLSWETLVDGTDEKVIYALVPERQTMAGLIINRGTALKNTPLVSIQGANTFADYVFVRAEAIRTQEGAFTRYSFVRDYGSDGTGTLVDTFPDTEESFYWPAVLNGIEFNHTEVYPDGSTSSGGNPTPFSKWGIQPKLTSAYHGLTKVTVRDYVSMVPFTDVPDESLHPTRVYWDLPGAGGSGSTPECLTTSVTTPACYESAIGPEVVPQRTFAATPQTSWVAHYYSCKVERRNGLYFKRTKQATPPPHSPGVS